MKMVLLFILLTSWSAQAFMKTGLWEIQTQFGDQKSDPMAKMREAMAKMPAEKRKQMEAMMQGMGVAAGSKGIKICVDETEAKQGDFLHRNENAKCQSKVVTKNAKNVVTEFNCEDGTKGRAEYEFPNTDEFKGVTKVTNAKGKTTEIKHQAKFLAKDCGNIKPIKKVANEMQLKKMQSK